MHSPLEIAKNFVEIGLHKVRLSAFKMLVLGIFAGIYIGFAGIASTTASATIENPSVARLLSACVFPAGMAMVLIAGSELFTGNNLIIISLLEKKIKLTESDKTGLLAALAVCLIGITTFVCSAAGLKVGNLFGLKYKAKAELAGGIILILIGLKILLEHLGVISF